MFFYLVYLFAICSLLHDCLFLTPSAHVTLSSRDMQAASVVGESIRWEIDVLGSHQVLPDERVRWEFEASDTTWMLGLARARDAKLFYPGSSPKVGYHYHCGWYYHLGSRARYWSIVNPNSQYMGEVTADTRYRSPGITPMQQISVSLGGRDRIVLELDGSHLTCSVTGKTPYTYEEYTGVDRSEPLVLAAILKGNTVKISKFSVFMKK
jgi:hypothetical protein